MTEQDNDNKVTLNDLKTMLADNAEALAEHLFGKPSKRTSRELRFGRKGSIRVGIDGPRAGRFENFASGEYGSMLDAIIFAYSCNLRGAIDHAKSWLGITEDQPLPKPKRRKPAPVVNVDAELEARRRQAVKIWNAAKAIPGTPAEAYLYGRGIEAATWPDSVRWSDETSALVVGSTVRGKVTQIQRIFLNQDGTPKLDEDGNKIKRSLGPGEGGSVRFPGDENGPLCLAEGPETGLSVWHATRHETWVSLGGIRADLSGVPLDREIIVCLDDDEKNAPSKKGINGRIKEWRKEGRTVLAYLPFDRSRRNKADFNDALQECGPEYICQRLAPDNVIALPNTLPVEEARKRLAKQMKASIAEFSKWWDEDGENQVPVHCFKVGLSIGKTEDAIKRAVRWAIDGLGSIAYTVPSHDLSSDLLERFKAEAGRAVSIAVWYGRAYKRIDQDGQTTAMCRNLDAVNDVQRIGRDPQDTVCIREVEVDGEPTVKKCEFYDDCPYQKQRQQRADIWIMAHQLLFTDKPAAFGKPSLLVIDESFYRAGLKGVEGHPIVISEDQIKAPIWAGRKDEAFAADQHITLDATLAPIRAKLAQVIQSHDTGPLPLETLKTVGLTAGDCLSASKAEWLRKVHVNIYPGMPKALFNKAISKAFVNTEIPRMAQLWKDLAEFIDGPHASSGRLSIEEIQDETTGGRYRAIRMRGKSEIDERWRAPTLHIDATMRMGLIRAYFPQAELKAEIDAAAPHQRIVQFYDKSFSHSSIAHNETQLAKLWTHIKATAVLKGGNWLVVVQKDIEDQIRAKYHIPDFIMLAHHNNIAGIDRWRNVDGVIVVGRTQPKPSAVEHIAGALTGEYIPPIDIEDGWYPSSTETVRAKNGGTITAEADRHPHALAEEVRASICEDQLLQIVGRGRGVNRTAADPLEVIVLGNVPFAVPDELQEWNEPTVDEAMLAEGVLFDNAEHAATAYPFLKSAVAIRMKRKRQKDQSVTKSYKNIPIGKRYTLHLVEYQKVGERQKRYSAIYDARMVPDIKAHLEGIVGELAYFAALEITLKEPEREAPPLDTVLDRWQSGLVPMPAVAMIGEIKRSTGMTQEAMAQRIGLSRPHLANALQGRFGLAPDIVARFKAFLKAPPPILQERLI
jgi:putative DNA primase/helicase